MLKALLLLLIPAAALAQTSGDQWLQELAAGSNAAPGAMTGTVLPVEEAFVFSFDVQPVELEPGAEPGERSNAPELVLNWQVAPGNYLYRDQLRVLDNRGREAVLRLPEGEWIHDPEFGLVEVYKTDVTARTLPAALATPEPGEDDAVELTVEYLGCASVGLCYPPQAATISVARASPAALTAVAVNRSETGIAASPWRDRLAEDRPNLVWLHADWCAPCKLMERTSFADAEVQAELRHINLVRIDVTDPETARRIGRELAVAGPPALLVFDTDGVERAGLRTMGRVNTADLLELLRAARQMQPMPGAAAFTPAPKRN